MKVKGMLGGILRLSSFTTPSQFIAFLNILTLSRFFDSSTVGLYAMLVSLISVGTIVLQSGSAQLVTISADKEFVRTLHIRMVRRCQLFVYLALPFVVIDFLMKLGSVSLQIPIAYIYLSLIAVSSTGMYNFQRSVRLRSNGINRVGLAQLSFSAVQCTTHFFFGYFSPSVHGLIFGIILGRLAGVYFLGIRFVEDDFSISQSNRNLKVINSNSDSKFLTISQSINIVTVSGVTFLVGILYGLDVVASFFLAYQFLSLPALFLGQVVVTVLLPEVARRIWTNEDYTNLIFRVFFWQVIISAPFFIAITGNLFGLTARVIGNSKLDTFECIQMLAPWMAISFIASSLSAIILANSRHSQTLFVGIVESLARAFVLLAGWYLEKPQIGLLFYSILGVIISIFWLVFEFRVAKVDDVRTVFSISSVLVYVLLLVLIGTRIDLE